MGAGRRFGASPTFYQCQEDSLSPTLLLSSSTRTPTPQALPYLRPLPGQFWTGSGEGQEWSIRSTERITHIEMQGPQATSPLESPYCLSFPTIKVPGFVRHSPLWMGLEEHCRGTGLGLGVGQTRAPSSSTTELQFALMLNRLFPPGDAVTWASLPDPQGSGPHS